nr:hypothetical protein [Tanacetum cinerariifolium]
MVRTRRGQTPPLTNPNNMTPEVVQTMIDQALLRNSSGRDGSHSAVGLTRWIEKMESVFNISGQIRTLGPDAYTMTWSVLKKKMTDNRFQELALICTKFVSNETEKVDKYISGLPNNIYGNVKSSKPKALDKTIELANDLMDQKLCTYAERKLDSKRKADDISRNNQQPFKKQNVAKAYNLGSTEKKNYEGNAPKSTGNTNATNNRGGNGPNPRGNGNGNAQGWVYAVGNAERNGNVAGNPDSNVVT